MQSLRLVVISVIFLSIHSSTTLFADSTTEPSLRNLDKAKDTYHQKAEGAKADLLKDFDTKEIVARNRGDKAAVDAIKAERAAFAENGRLPQVVSTKAYEGRMKAALVELDAAYTTAIRELVRNRMDDEATAVQKELDALRSGAGMLSSWINLLELADLSKQAYSSRWKKEGDALTVNRGADWSVVLLRYAPPEEYELEAVVDRIPATGEGCFEVGTVVGNNRFFMIFDSKGDTGIAYVDGKAPNETYARFHIGTSPVKIQIVVSKTGVTVTSGGKEICKYTGRPDRLSEGSGPKTGFEPGALFVGAAPDAGFHVKNLRVKAISGKGKVLLAESKPGSH